MNLLLDTHTVIWAFTDDPTLSNEARSAVVDGANLVFVSAATAWETAIKKALGKLQTPDNLLEELERLTLVSRDQRLRPYGVPVLVARAVAHPGDPKTIRSSGRKPAMEAWVER